MTEPTCCPYHNLFGPNDQPCALFCCAYHRMNGPDDRPCSKKITEEQGRQIRALAQNIPASLKVKPKSVIRKWWERSWLYCILWHEATAINDGRRPYRAYCPSCGKERYL